MTLAELADRCEQATGANKMLDEAIYEALGVVPSRDHSFVYPYYAYTASLDAAMTLVPEGHCGQVQFGKHPGAWVEPLGEENPADFNVAATPALALCAAALRARSA